jgi:hypothetical protein
MKTFSNFARETAWWVWAMHTVPFIRRNGGVPLNDGGVNVLRHPRFFREYFLPISRANDKVNWHHDHVKRLSFPGSNLKRMLAEA